MNRVSSKYCYLQQSLYHTINTVTLSVEIHQISDFNWHIHISPLFLPVFPLRWISFWTVLKSRRELPDFFEKKTRVKILRTFDNCVDKVLLDNFLTIHVVTKTLQSNNVEKLSKNIASTHFPIHCKHVHVFKQPWPQLHVLKETELGVEGSGLDIETNAKCIGFFPAKYIIAHFSDA